MLPIAKPVLVAMALLITSAIAGADEGVRELGFPRVPADRETTFLRPSLRAAFGIGSSPVGFRFDLAGGAHFTYRAVRSDEWGFLFHPEVGFSYAKGPPDALLFAAGLGLGAGKLWQGAYFQPSFVVGRQGGETALGVRNALRYELLNGGLGFELSHQYLRVAGADLHEARVMVALDPIMAFATLMWSRFD